MPDEIPISSLSNQLIAHMPIAIRKILLAKCDTVELIRGDLLCEAGKPYPYIYFPTSSEVALVVTLSNLKKLEQGGVGCEGMLGATLALGLNVALLDAMVQSSGTAMRMGSENFDAMLRGSPALVTLVLRYLYAHLAQLSQNSACAYFHTAEMRVARYLLTTSDRTHTDHFHLTHGELAKILGLRRSSVTTSAGSMQRRHFIHYSRGEIRILDRSGLESAACECYGVLSALLNYPRTPSFI